MQVLKIRYLHVIGIIEVHALVFISRSHVILQGVKIRGDLKTLWQNGSVIFYCTVWYTACNGDSSRDACIQRTLNITTVLVPKKNLPRQRILAWSSMITNKVFFSNYSKNNIHMFLGVLTIFLGITSNPSHLEPRICFIQTSFLTSFVFISNFDVEISLYWFM